MTTLEPREPYSQEELAKLYPACLELKHVQIILRHGERTPVKHRFQNAGLHPYWPYCSIARQMLTTVLIDPKVDRWSSLQFRRKLEIFGPKDTPILASGPSASNDSICLPGELTDLGRATTLSLGKRLRNLYVDQLHFLPANLPDTRPSDLLYVRSTPIPRALESTQQALLGLYPFPTWSEAAKNHGLDIVTRAYGDENLVPNDPSCARFHELSELFAARAAEKHGPSSPEIQFLNRKLGKYMKDGAKVAVDGKPRLSGIMDTTSASLAHRHLSRGTQLPEVFYEAEVRETIDSMVTEEWFEGYRVSNEYRTLGIGSLLSDMARRAVRYARHSSSNTQKDGTSGHDAQPFTLSGAHDTTIAAVLASLGAFPRGSKWPRFTSNIALETFALKDSASNSSSAQDSFRDLGTQSSVMRSKGENESFWRRYFPTVFSSAPVTDPLTSSPVPPKHFVRIRYNDAIVNLPFCSLPGKHLDGDEGFCTLEAFVDLVKSFAPTQDDIIEEEGERRGGWRRACRQNLGKGLLDESISPNDVIPERTGS